MAAVGLPNQDSPRQLRRGDAERLGGIGQEIDF
jgi:hypothetical protein